MQSLTLTIPFDGYAPGDQFAVFGNVNVAGQATTEIDFDSPITGASARPIWTAIGPLALFLNGPWLGELWLSAPAIESGFLGGHWLLGRWLPDPDSVFDLQITTPVLYFGTYLFAVKTYDNLGNVNAAAPAEFEVSVNSGPRPVRRFHQTGVAGGLPAFSLDPPIQFGAIS